MKLKILLMFILGTMAAFSLFGTAGATTKTETVTPSVTVGSTLSLIIENPENVQWVSQSAGDNPTGTIQAKISANANWTLTVQSGSNLAHTDGNHWLGASSSEASCSCFTFTSTAAGLVGQGISNSTRFDILNGNGVWTGGTSVSNGVVEITYNLQIPATQYPGTYTATHTYTLTSP